MDAWLEVCQGLEAAGVRYLIVGMFGVNLYAGQGAQGAPLHTTRDCDVLLPPDPDELLRAVRLLRDQGWAVEAGTEPLAGEDPLIFRNLVSFGARVQASRGDAVVDLPLQIAGASFAELWPRQRRFVVEDVSLRVAALADIVRSKELAGRPKDRLFLESFRAELRDLIERDRAPDDAPPPPG